jgi:hypothetical protein
MLGKEQKGDETIQTPWAIIPGTRPLFQMNLVNWLMWTVGCLRHLVIGG